MPGIHSSMSRHLFTLNGNVSTSGGAKNLAKGQFTIVKSASATANGAEIVSNFAGLPKNTVFELRLGKHKIPNTRTAQNSQSYKSETFKISDVAGVKGNYPKNTKQTFDDILIGYDGVNDNTAIELAEGQTTVLDVTLSGEHVGFITGNCEHSVKLHFGREVGETNQEAVNRLVERLKEQTFPQGLPITETVDIKPIDSSKGALQGTSWVFSELVLSDEGDSNAIAEVQAQYPTYKVVRSAREDGKSTYTILHPSGASLSAFSQTVPKYLKDCEDCAAGYSEISQDGIVYSVTLEDDGTDQTALVDDLPGFVATSVNKKGNNGGVGTYTVVVDDELTSAEISAYVAIAGIKSTATIEKLGTVKEVCYDNTVVSTSWATGKSCTANADTYTIQLKDDDCDGSILTQLQQAYPNLVIEEGKATGDATQTVTITGTSGTANVTIAGVDYLATFNTDLDTTASDFVTSHATAILTATGVTVTSGTASIVLDAPANDFPSDVAVANVSGDLAGTAAAIDYEVNATTGGCQRVYSTQVVTDVVCSECDPIFLDNFTSKAPESFNFSEWELVELASDENAKMGVRITGKPFIMVPTEATRDQIPFYETSTRVEASGGYIQETSNSFEPNFSNIFNIKRLSRAQDRDNLGGYLMDIEDASRYYFDGEVRHVDNLFAKAVLGEESVLDFQKQYVSYEVEILDNKRSQGVGRSSDFGTSYLIWAPFGEHEALEDYVNSLAVASGNTPVQISAE
jgi:hypothetical protein